MKKLLVFLLVFVLLFSSYAGCQEENPNKQPSGQAKTEFTVTIGEVVGGTLTADKQTVKIGESVTFSFRADTNFVLYEFVINGGVVKKSETDNQIYFHEMTSVMSDVTASVTFVDPRVDVTFDTTSLCKDNFENKSVIMNEPFGELPEPFVAGYRFLGWIDGNGMRVDANSLVLEGPTINLTAQWVKYNASYSADLKPFSLTASYYNKDCTNYGVVWHTDGEPITSVIEIVEKSRGQTVQTANFSNARIIGTVKDTYLASYISSGVIDQLEFNTTYFVRVGDLAADVWSNTYEFTTREENPSETNFLYFSDTHTGSWSGRPSNETPYATDGTPINKSFYRAMIEDGANKYGDVDMVIHGGDFFKNGSSYYEAKDALTDLQSVTFDYPTQVVSGNHDSLEYGGGNKVLGSLYHYDCNENTEKVGTTMPYGDYYSFNYGRVHFVALNSNDLYVPTGNPAHPYRFRLNEDQYNWLVTDLANVDKSETPWVIVYMHEAFLNGSDKWFSPENFAGQLLPVFEQYGVDLLLFGHIHRNLITYPLVWDEDMPQEDMYNGAYINYTTRDYTLVDHDNNPDTESLTKFNYPTSGSRGTVCYAPDSGMNSGEHATWKYRNGLTKQEAVDLYGTTMDVNDAWGSYSKIGIGFVDENDWSDTDRYVISQGVSCSYETSATQRQLTIDNGTYMKRFPMKYIYSFSTSNFAVNANANPAIDDLDGTQPKGLTKALYYQTYTYVKVSGNRLIIENVFLDAKGLIQDCYNEGVNWKPGYSVLGQGVIIEK